MKSRVTSQRAMLAALAGLVSVLGWMGHRLAFMQFQQYDDEGYLLITVQQFLDGFRLYDDVYTQYGPAYYLWEQALHGTLSIPITHDATRAITLVVWLVCAALIAIPVWLLTERAVLAAVGMAIAFFHLTQLTFEPGHPQELCLVAVAAAVALVTWRLRRAVRLGTAPAVTLGALVAVAVLTKPNVGVFLGGGLLLAFATSAQHFSGRTVACGIVAAAALAAVPAVLRENLMRADVAAFAIVISSGLVAALLVSFAARGEGVVTVRELIAGALGFSTVAFTVIAAILERGSSAGALIDGLFISPLRFASSLFWTRLPVPPLAGILAAAWVGLAWLNLRKVPVVVRAMPQVAVVAAILVVLVSVTKGYGVLLALGPPIAWLALVFGHQSPADRSARRVLAFVAVMVALQAYPMPGTQVALATVLLIPLALITIADVAGELRLAGSRSATVTGPRLRGTFAALALVPVIAVGWRIERAYANGVPLDLPGAGSVRTNERDASTYRWLVTNLRQHCDGFISAPGFNSLHFWTGIRPISSLNTTLWPILLTAPQQERVVEAAASVSRLCVAWETRRMRALVSARDAASDPLFVYLSRGFVPQASFGGWEFRLRRGHRAELIYQAHRLDDGDVLLNLPALGAELATRVEVVDLDARRALSDTASRDSLMVIGEDGTDAQQRGGIDVSRPRRLRLRDARIPPRSDQATLVVRLLGRADRLLAVVPVVTVAGGAEDVRDRASGGAIPSATSHTAAGQTGRG